MLARFSHCFGKSMRERLRVSQAQAPDERWSTREMAEQPMRILLIQDNPEYASRLSQGLSESANLLSTVKAVTTLREGLTVLSKEEVDIVLLELSLPDSEGLETYEKVQIRVPAVPVVILTHLDDEILALRAVRAGAQDYLLKGEVEGKILPRVIRYAIERQRMRTQLLSLSIRDELTGLYNRRGFLLLAEQQMKLAHRTKKGILFFLADLDGLKQINDLYGHQLGDMALRAAAEILRQTFRSSDILARFGGDEFAMVAIEADHPCISLLKTRLYKHLQDYNARKLMPYVLSVSTGVTHFDAKSQIFLDQLITQADQALYEQKRLREKA